VTTTASRDAAIRRVHDLIKDINICMLTTSRPDGSLHSRPMATQQTEFDGELWFFTAKDSLKVDETNDRPAVNVSYADASHNRYVSVSGTGTLVHDRKMAEQLWNPMYKAWFPKGLDDPQLALLRVDVEEAEYWDAPSSTMVHVVGFVKALLTGKQYAPGEHATVSMNPASHA
jgi:general stress protein 26